MLISSVRNVLLTFFLVATGYFFVTEIHAQTSVDCRKAYDMEDYKCFDVFNDCQSICSKETKKPDGTTYFNSGEIYPKCIKENQCHEKSDACHEQALVNYRSCLDALPDDEEDQTEDLSGKVIPGYDHYGGGQKISCEELKEFNSGSSKQCSYLLVQEIGYVGSKSYNVWCQKSAGEHQSAIDEGISYGLRHRPRYYFMFDFEDCLAGGIKEDEPTDIEMDKETRRVAEAIGKFADVVWKMFGEINRSPEVKQPGYYLEPKITEEVEEEAWKMPVTAGERVTDVPGTTDTKRYSWDSDSGAVIRSTNWEQTEVKPPVINNGDFFIRDVKFKQGEVEVKLRNDRPAENRFKVEAADFLDAVTIETHFLVSYNPDARQSTVIVYEGKVEVKTNDGKTHLVSPVGDKPGVLIVTQKLSFVKLTISIAVISTIIVVVAGLKSFKKKSKT